MALTEKQRKAILERDDHTSQLLHYSEEEGFHRGGYCGDETWKTCSNLHVHHIRPQGVDKDAGLSREDRDDPRNLITLFKCEHVGICDDHKMKL